MQKLLNTNFGKLIATKTEENRIDFTVELNPQHDIYRGHFPHKPITPGVCSLQMIRELLEVHFQVKLRLKKADNIKFAGMIDPHQVNVVNFKITISPEQFSEILSVKASIESSDNVFCKFTGEYLKM